MRRLIWIRVPFIASLPIALAACPPENPAPDTPADFTLTSLEVVQAVQTIGAGMPLVGYKPTFVRAYVKSVEKGHGPWKISARLRVTDIDSNTTVELKPLSFDPDLAITVTPSGSRRDLWNDSFTFVLDAESTKPGTRFFEARAFAGSDVPNAPSNHVVTRQDEFRKTVYASVYGAVWAVTDPKDSQGAPQGPPASWLDFDEHRIYTESTYPVSGLAVKPLPGIGKAAPKPQTLGDLIGSRAWASKMLGNLPLGSKLNLLDNWDTGGLNGYAWGSACEEQNARDWRVGLVMAQEISHTFGNWCHTFDVCDAYPRPGGEIDPNDIGFNLSSNYGHQFELVGPNGQRYPDDSISAPGNVYDIMSYGPLKPGPAYSEWVSSFTYCQLVKAIWPDGESTPCVPGVLSAGVGAQSTKPELHGAMTPLDLFTTPQSFLFVSGAITNGLTVDFDPPEEIPSLADIATPATKSPNFSLLLHDANDAVLAKTDFHFEGSTHGTGTKSPWSVIVPYETFKGTAVSVSIANIAGLVLGKRSLATSPPTATFLSTPAAGGDGVVRGKQSVSWRAVDTSGPGPLHYTLLYSADGGKSFWPLHVDLTDTTVEVDFDTVPGSAAGLLKVRASNGGRSAEVSSAAFRVDRQAPDVSLTKLAVGTLVDPRVPLIIHGSAFTWEDGSITDPSALAWSIDGAPAGKAPWIVLRDLAAGQHTIALVASAPDGRTSRAETQVTVAGK